MKKNLFLSLLAAAVLPLAFMACTPDDNEEYAEYTGESQGSLKGPWIHYAADLPYEHETTWMTVAFGSYPQAEVLAAPCTAVDDYALDEGITIVDAQLYAQLEAADWQHGVAVVNGERYARLTSADVVSWATDRRGHYRWTDGGQCHYFKFQPVTWRILNIKGNIALLMADRALDCQRFHNTDEEVCWATCDYRKWLNTEVFDRMFSAEEKKSVLLSDVHNADNYYFGTSCGPDTQDHLFILSEEEVFCSEKARLYGFLETDGLDDPARRFRPSMYAMCRGAWISPVETYKGNTFWFMRSTGYTPYNVTYVCEFGYLYNRGTIVTCDDSGVVPVMRVDLNTASLQPLGEVSSNTIIQG